MSRLPNRFAVACFICATVGYATAARFGLLFIVRPEGVAAIWPAAGLALGALLLVRPAGRPAVAAGVFCGSFIGNATGGFGLPESLLFSVVNTGESCFAAVWLLRTTGPGTMSINAPGSVFRLAGVAVCAALCSAAAGAAATVLLGAGDSFWLAWRLWFCADAFGIIGFTPLLLALPHLSRPRLCRTCVESLLLFVVSGLVALALALVNGPNRPLIFNYPIAILLPVVLWAAVRLDAARTAIATIIVCGTFCIATVNGVGPFASNSYTPGERVAALQLACITFCVSALALAAYTAEYRRMRVLAESATLAKSAFVANVSHDIRNPLTTILGYVQLLLAGEQPRPIVEKHLRTIQRNGDHLLLLLNDVLDLSKVEAGKLHVERVEVCTRTLLQDLVDLYGERAAAKRIAFEVRLVGPVPRTLLTDPTRLRQILFNLVGNAIKFTLTGGVRIHCGIVSAGSSPATMRFEVLDSGIGLTGPQVQLLFAPFQQADPSHGKRFGGSGLGLSIARRLADLLGGRIGVSSVIDQGSTFTLDLPKTAWNDGVDMMHDWPDVGVDGKTDAVDMAA